MGIERKLAALDSSLRNRIKFWFSLRFHFLHQTRIGSCMLQIVDSFKSATHFRFQLNSKISLITDKR